MNDSNTFLVETLRSLTSIPSLGGWTEQIVCLTLKLLQSLTYKRVLFKHYRSDLAAAVEAVFDFRNALIAIGLGGSHGHERTHLDAIHTASELAHTNLLSPLLD